MKEAIDLVSKSLDLSTESIKMSSSALEKSYNSFKLACYAFAFIFACGCGVFLYFIDSYFYAPYGYPDPPVVEQSQTTTQQIITGEGDQ